MKSGQSKIYSCRICGSKSLEPVILLSAMPLTDEFVSSSTIGKEFISDIEISVCNTCGSSQNARDTVMSEYYNEYTYSVQSSEFALAFMRILAERIKRNYFSKKESPKIIEIGSGTGEQLMEFKKLGFDVLGVEPSEKLVKHAESIGIPTIHAFFDNDIESKLPSKFKNVDLILSSYTFDHIPYPRDAAKMMHHLLCNDGIMVHEVHDLDLIEQRNEYCLFEHEHYTYLNQRTMSAFLSSIGFDAGNYDLLLQKEKRANSLLVVAGKSNSSLLNKVNPKEEIQRMKDLSLRIKNSISHIEKWLTKNENLKIVAYGAGGRGVMTLAALNHTGSITYMVDKNPKSTHIFAPKSHLPVYGINHLGIERADLILIFSFGYFDEIVEELGRKFNYEARQFISILDLLK